jgi:26S proteasome regulatory subunit N2
VIASSLDPFALSSLQSETDSRLRSILSGEQTIRLHMQFLIKNNHTDMLVLKQLKESVRTASAHNATVIANGLMHCGTTCDDFLRWELCRVMGLCLQG